MNGIPKYSIEVSEVPEVSLLIAGLRSRNFITRKKNERKEIDECGITVAERQFFDRGLASADYFLSRAHHCQC